MKEINCYEEKKKRIILSIYYDPNTFIGDRMDSTLTINYAHLTKEQKIEMIGEIYMYLERLSNEFVINDRIKETKE